MVRKVREGIMLSKRVRFGLVYIRIGKVNIFFGRTNWGNFVCLGGRGGYEVINEYSVSVFDCLVGIFFIYEKRWNFECLVRVGLNLIYFKVFLRSRKYII